MVPVTSGHSIRHRREKQTDSGGFNKHNVLKLVIFENNSRSARAVGCQHDWQHGEPIERQRDPRELSLKSLRPALAHQQMAASHLSARRGEASTRTGKLCRCSASERSWTEVKEFFFAPQPDTKRETQQQEVQPEVEWILSVYENKNDVSTRGKLQTLFFFIHVKAPNVVT